MADNKTDPEVKKNDASDKNTQASTASTSKSSTVPSSSNSNVSTKSSIPKDIKYLTEDLIENSKALTGYEKEVAVGALFNCNEKELTKDAFKKVVENFLRKKVE